MLICFDKLLYLKLHPNFGVFVLISVTHYCNSSRGYKYRIYGTSASLPAASSLSLRSLASLRSLSSFACFSDSSLFIRAMFSNLDLRLFAPAAPICQHKRLPSNNFLIIHFTMNLFYNIPILNKVTVQRINSCNFNLLLSLITIIDPITRPCLVYKTLGAGPMKRLRTFLTLILFFFTFAFQ